MTTDQRKVGSSRGGCFKSYLGVQCQRQPGHSGVCEGWERGRNEIWRWTDDPMEDLVTIPASEVTPLWLSTLGL